ncbi:MAG TPA: O-methyltransferase [Caulobacteraceae bacterium]|nr:O-methyltransferase [Caulobacteraceae bacterium]
MDDDLLSQVDRYIDALFAVEDAHLAAALAQSKAAGLPDIQVSAGQGKFLYLLAKIAGARRILELGTLGGYSTIWLARALPPDGRLVSLEYEPRHAQVAGASLARAGLADKVEVVVGPALETLPGVIARAGGPFDLVFVDADKVNYSNYLRLIMGAVRSGSLILADNVIRRGAILADRPADEAAAAARDFNALLAADDRLEAVILQQVGVKGHDGLAIARVK